MIQRIFYQIFAVINDWIGFRLRKGLKQSGAILIAAFLLAFAYTKHELFRQSWGFPFEYRVKIDPGQAYPGKIEAVQTFNPLILFWDVFLLFFVFTLLWFIAKNLITFIENYTYKNGS